MDEQDRDALARFRHRFGAIDREIPKAPGLWAAPRRPAVPRLVPVLLAAVAIVATLVLGGSLIQRTPEPGLVGGSASAPPGLSPSPATPETTSPGAVICGAPPVTPTPPAVLTCDRAVTAALTVVRSEGISSIRFAYGGYCPPWARCASVPPTMAHVIVSWFDRSPDMVVVVAVDESGALEISAPEPLPTPPPPTDPGVEAVSLSSPSAEAAVALERCRVADWIEYYGPDVIAGVGRIDHARDAVRYVPLTGREPEIQSDRPAWLVQLRGEIRIDRLFVFVDPVCVVVDGDSGYFGTGTVKMVETGVTITPQPIASPPDRTLPPPLP